MENKTVASFKLSFLRFSALAAIILTAVLIGIFSSPPGNIDLYIRITGLAGAICLTLAALSSAFVREIFKITHRPFKQAHHLLAISGTALITLHPLLVAWQLDTLKFFVPIVDSWPDFLSWGGRVGIILIYLGMLAAIFMKKIPRQWREVHWLLYVGLWLGVIHGLRLGRDLAGPTARIVTWIILSLIVGVFAYKRLRNQSQATKKSPA
jgi:hypothetical protein